MNTWGGVNCSGGFTFIPSFIVLCTSKMCKQKPMCSHSQFIQSLPHFVVLFIPAALYVPIDSALVSVCMLFVPVKCFVLSPVPLFNGYTQWHMCMNIYHSCINCGVAAFFPDESRWCWNYCVCRGGGGGGKA